jgi:hypothetical protein
MKTTDMASYYIKATSTCDFYMWDSLNITLPNNYKGRLLEIGVYDLIKESKFQPVVACGTENLSLNFSDVQTATAKEYGAMVLDGYTVAQGDRILLVNQENSKENGIYIVVSTGGDSEYYSLKRSSDACSTATMLGGNLVFVTKGDTLANHLYQLVPYDVYAMFGSTDFNFIDLTKEGFYSNCSYGLRLINSVMCNQLEVGPAGNQFNFACPDFINNQSKRLIKCLVPYNVDISKVMQSLLDSKLTFIEAKPTNVVC